MHMNQCRSDQNGKSKSDIDNLILDYLAYKKRMSGQNGNHTDNGLKNEYSNDSIHYFENYDYDYNYDIIPKDYSEHQYNDYQYIDFSDGYYDETYSDLTAAEYDNEYIKRIYCPISQKIHPIVEKILDQYDYEYSAMYEDYIDKESLAQMVDRVINIAKNDIAEVEEMILEAENNCWERYSLVYALIEAMLLHEVYFIRRPRKKKMNNYQSF